MDRRPLAKYKKSNLGLNPRPSYVVVLITLIVVYVVAGIIVFASPHGGDDSQYFLLSTLGQVLASIFGLTFILGLAIVQLTTSYSPRMLFYNKLFWIITIGYMLAFSGTIMIVITSIKTPSFITIDRLLIWSTLLVSALPLYFIILVRELSPKHVLRWTEKVAQEELEHGKDYSEKIQAVHNVVMYSLTHRDYDTVELGLNTLLSLMTNAAKIQGQSVFSNLTYKDKWMLIAGSRVHSFSERAGRLEVCMVEGLCKLVHICVVPEDDPYIPTLVLSRVNDWVVEKMKTARETADWQAMDKFIVAQAATFLLAAERKQADTAWWILDCFRKLSTISVETISKNEDKENSKERRTFRVDYVTGAAVTLASVRLHLPGFEDTSWSIIDALAENFADAFEQGVCAANEFIIDVFPELPRVLPRF